MEEDKKGITILKTENDNGIIALSILGMVLIKSLLFPGVLRTQEILLLIFLLAIVFFLPAGKRIIIKSNKIFLPGPNPFSKTIVDIASIRKIIKYPSLADGNQLGEEVGAGNFREISIIYLDAKNSIRLKCSNWGVELINELIETILEKNENVQVVDYERLFNEKKL